MSQISVGDPGQNYSGAYNLTPFGGLAACLWGSAAMLGLCLPLVFLLPSESEARAAFPIGKPSVRLSVPR